MHVPEHNYTASAAHALSNALGYMLKAVEPTGQGQSQLSRAFVRIVSPCVYVSREGVYVSP